MSSKLTNLFLVILIIWVSVFVTSRYDIDLIQANSTDSSLPDINIIFYSPSKIIHVGEEAVYTVTIIQVEAGSLPSLSMSLSGLPEDTSYLFSPSSGELPFTTELILDTTGSPPGTYNFTLTVAGEDITRTATATLIIIEKDFELIPLSKKISVTQNSLTALLIEVVSIADFNQQVTLSVSGIPTNVSSLFTPSSDTPPFTSVLTIEAPSSATIGAYTLTVEAKGGEKTHTKEIPLAIEKAPLELSISIEGRTAKIAGTMTPPKQGAQITLYYEGGEGEKITRQVTVDSNGDFHDDFSPEASGGWIVRATLQDNGDILYTSETESFVIPQQFAQIHNFISFIVLNPLIIVIFLVAIVIIIVFIMKRQRKRSVSTKNTLIS